MKNLKYSPNADDILENTVPIEYLVKYSRAFELPRERRMNEKEEKVSSQNIVNTTVVGEPLHFRADLSIKPIRTHFS